jgi:inward rectifier potassium channel
MTPPRPAPSVRGPRLVPRQDVDRARIIPVGARRVFMQDSYVHLLAASWRRLILVIVAGWLGLNMLFAVAYAWFDGIQNARAHSFSDAFFFSVETFATIGYGRMAPLGLAAHLIMTVEAMTGFIFYAFATGLIFSKFSRPTARVLFSNVAIVAPYNGKRHLMLRLANERGNGIVDAVIRLTLLRNEITKEGQSMRRFTDLELTRSAVPLLRISWTALHPIDEKSPLFGETLDSLRAADAEIIISLSGLDETLSQIIHARFSYQVDEVVFDATFEDVIHRNDRGDIEVHFHKFHDVKPLAPAQSSSSG